MACRVDQPESDVHLRGGFFPLSSRTGAFVDWAVVDVADDLRPGEARSRHLLALLDAIRPLVVGTGIAWVLLGRLGASVLRLQRHDYPAFLGNVLLHSVRHTQCPRRRRRYRAGRASRFRVSPFRVAIARGRCACKPYGGVRVALCDGRDYEFHLYASAPCRGRECPAAIGSYCVRALATAPTGKTTKHPWWIASGYGSPPVRFAGLRDRWRTKNWGILVVVTTRRLSDVYCLS